MISSIHVYKISDTLYRVRNKEKGTVKDVWVSEGNVVFPENKENILTPIEQTAIEMELF